MRKMNLRPQGSGPGWFTGMRRFGRAGLGLLLAAGLSTCGPGHGTDCLKSTGSIITQQRTVEPGLLTVTTLDNVDLHLVQDSKTFAEVRAGENLIEDIQLTRKGNSLEISNSSRCNWVRSYDAPREVTLHLPRITNVFLRGYGNINTVGTFAQDTIFFHLVGAGDYDLSVQARLLFLDQYELGDITVRGSATDINFTLGGSGRLFAQGITPKHCYFNMTRDSEGDAHVRATDAVGGYVRGTGTLYYGGPPASTDIRISGRGGSRPE